MCAVISNQSTYSTLSYKYHLPSVWPGTCYSGWRWKKPPKELIPSSWPGRQLAQSSTVAEESKHLFSKVPLLPAGVSTCGLWAASQHGCQSVPTQNGKHTENIMGCVYKFLLFSVLFLSMNSVGDNFCCNVKRVDTLVQVQVKRTLTPLLSCRSQWLYPSLPAVNGSSPA